MRLDIRRRASWSSLFVLDNSHEKYDVLNRVVNRLAPQKRSGHLAIVCLARSTPSLDEQDRDDEPEFVRHLIEAAAVVDFETSRELFRQVIALTKPDFEGLSRDRLDRVLILTGRDLYLLDEFLNHLHTPQDIDQVEPSAPIMASAARADFGQAKPPKPQRNEVLKDSNSHPESPKVAETVIEVPFGLRSWRRPLCALWSTPPLVVVD